MSITVLALGGAWASVLNLLRWLLPSHAPHQSSNQQHALSCPSPQQQSPLKTLTTVNNTPARTSGRPLRVVQWLEQGQSPSQVGRLVISGRLSDVCAELDRLVERESSRH